MKTVQEIIAGIENIQKDIQDCIRETSEQRDRVFERIDLTAFERAEMKENLNYEIMQWRNARKQLEIAIEALPESV